MSVENGEWIMRELDWKNPYRIRTWQELVNWINEIEGRGVVKAGIGEAFRHSNRNKRPANIRKLVSNSA